MLVNLLVMGITLLLGMYFLRFERTSSMVGSDGLVYYLQHTGRKYYIQCISVVLILQSGLRNVAVGADTYAYYLTFESIKRQSWSELFWKLKEYYLFDEGKDPGYAVFQKSVQIFTGDYQVFLFVIAILFFSSLGYFIYRNTNRLSDAIFAFILYSALFYSFFSITGHRQTIATAAALYSFEWIKKRKLVHFIVLILLASTIHKSVMVFLPFYFIVRIKNVKYFFLSIIIFLPLFFLYKAEYSQFFKTLSGYDHGVYTNAGTWTFTAMIIIIALSGAWRFNLVTRINPSAQIFYLAFGVALVFTPLTWVDPSAMRVVQYFSIFMLLLVPELIHSFKYESTTWRNFLYTTALALILIFYVQSGSGHVYKFFWQGMNLGINYR
jgi:transmembrane protein EpsG